jgi:hypothetical protein
MVERSIGVTDTAEVVVPTCQGNLRVRSGDADGVRVLIASEDDLVTWGREGGDITAAFGASATMVVPPETRVTAEQVLGNLRIEGVRGEIEARAVHGNATLRHTGTARLNRVLGNLRASHAGGDVTADEVRGNVWARGVSGALALGEVAGNLEVEGAEGGLTVEGVRGNVSLRPPFSAGSTYRVNGFGNLCVSLLSESSMQVAVRAGGRLDVKVQGLSLEQRGEEAVGTLGAGAATLKANVHGNVTLLGAEPRGEPGTSSHWEEIGAQIEWQVHDALAKMATELEERLGRVDGQWVGRQVDGATIEARRRAEQAAERARMRAEQAERRWRRAAGERPTPEPEGATDEERLRVLRMVEEGKITPEQAADLLGAIEGR